MKHGLTEGCLGCLCLAEGKRAPGGGRPRRSEPMLWHLRRRIRRRAGAFGLSAGVAMDLRVGWDLGQRADQAEEVE